MFGFITGRGGGGGGGGAEGGGGGGGRKRRRTWWSLGGGGAGSIDDPLLEAAAAAGTEQAAGEDDGGGGDDDDGMGEQQQQQQQQQQEDEGASPGVDPSLPDIERRRQQSIRENRAFLRSLGIGETLAQIRGGEAAAAGADATGKQQQQQQQQQQRRKRQRPGPSSPYAAPTLEQVARKWAGREGQVAALARLLPTSRAVAAASEGRWDAAEAGAASSVLLVHGPSGTGKTGVLRDVLAARRLPHAFVRGPEHPTARSLYGAVAAAWMRFIEARARAMGAEGLGYVEVDDADIDHAEALAAERAQRQARREGRRKRRLEERRRRRRAARRRKRAAEGGGAGGGNGEESSGCEDTEEEDEDGFDDEDEDDDDNEEEGGWSDVESSDDEEEEEEADLYYSQLLPAAGGKGSGGAGAASGTAAQLMPLNRVGTAAGLLHLLRSWKGFGQPSSSSSQQQQQQQQLAGSEDITPFVIVVDNADRLPRGAAHVRHELVELPALLASHRARAAAAASWGGGGAGGGQQQQHRVVVALTVVLVSELPVAAPGALEAGHGLPVPFPSYSKAQATAILLRSLRVAAGLGAAADPSAPAAAAAPAASSGGSGGAFDALVASFASLLVAALHGSTRDVREMRRMAALLSEKYLGPVLEATAAKAKRRSKGRAPGRVPSRQGGGGGGGGDGKENRRGEQGEEEEGQGEEEEEIEVPSPTALLERIRPLMQRAVHSCLHVPAEPLEQPRQPVAAAASSDQPGGGLSSSSAAAALVPTTTRFETLLRYELPILARYLVVASYLASHLSPDSDLQLFTTKSRGKKRSKREANAQERQAEEREAEAERAGARAFSLERLLSIFTCLLAFSRAQGAAYANSTGTTELFAQINTLVHHRLLTRVGPGGAATGGSGDVGGSGRGRGRGGTGGAQMARMGGELGAARFKCNVGYDLVLVTARELEIQLNMYLEAGRQRGGGTAGEA